MGVSNGIRVTQICELTVYIFGSVIEHTLINNNMNDDYKELYIDTYWKYYLKLENRLCKTEEFVAFDNANKKAFSIEYLSLLQIICSEIDVVAKTISAYYNKDFDFKDSSIIKWGYEIQNDLPGIMDQGVLFNNKEIIQPWRNWSLEERKDKNGKRYYGYSKGCGKSTQGKALAERLAQFGYTVRRTREPGGCPIAEEIRKIVLAKEEIGRAHV